MLRRGSLGTGAEVKEYLERLRHAGCKTQFLLSDGIAEAIDEDGSITFRALQKGRGGPWILMFRKTSRLDWVEGEPFYHAREHIGGAAIERRHPNP